MVETAQSYLGVALPLLSVRVMIQLSYHNTIILFTVSIKRKERTPTLKAAVRLLRTIFTTALNVTEFQRHVSTPNVLKFTTALTALAENHGDTDLKVN